MRMGCQFLVQFWFYSGSVEVPVVVYTIWSGRESGGRTQIQNSDENDILTYSLIYLYLNVLF